MSAFQKKNPYRRQWIREQKEWNLPKLHLCTAYKNERQYLKYLKHKSQPILGDPGAVSRDDTMFVVKVYCKIDLTVNFHHGHCIVPTNCPWVSEDGPNRVLKLKTTRTLVYCIIWKGLFSVSFGQNWSPKLSRVLSVYGLDYIHDWRRLLLFLFIRCEWYLISSRQPNRFANGKHCPCFSITWYLKIIWFDQEYPGMPC